MLETPSPKGGVSPKPQPGPADDAALCRPRPPPRLLQRGTEDPASPHSVLGRRTASGGAGHSWAPAATTAPTAASPGGCPEDPYPREALGGLLSPAQALWFMDSVQLIDLLRASAPPFHGKWCLLAPSSRRPG